MKQVIRNHQPLIEETPEDNTEESQLVQDKIRELTEEVNRQQMVISQASQALNLCNATPEFSGSTEQVEAEKLLLLASKCGNIFVFFLHASRVFCFFFIANRRQAALHEIQRLKVEGTLRTQSQHAQNLPLEKGSLTITNITLPLKREYVRALAAGMFFFCISSSYLSFIFHCA